MLAVARPGSRPKHQVGDLAQAGAIVARVGRVERVDPARKLQMSPAGWHRRCEGTDCGEPRLQMVVVRKLETQRDRPGQYGAIDDVEANGKAGTIDQQMLVDRSAQHANCRVGSIENARAVVRGRTDPDGDHARVHDRRP